MKQYRFLFLLAILLLSLTACSSGISKDEYTEVKSRLDSMTDGYEYPEYEKFNSPAKENGLGETKLYFIGKIVELEWKYGTRHAIVEADGGRWLVIFYSEVFTSTFDIESLNNETIAFWGTYLGFSEVVELPAVFCEAFVYNGNIYAAEGYLQEKDHSSDLETSSTSPDMQDEMPVASEPIHSETPPVTPNTNATETIGQRNAVRLAKEYLNYSAFSYQGLIDQLEYEQFSHQDAVYGADHCGADWYEQAAKLAESYLKYSAFSRNSLIEQLEYEGFTHDQAVYGVEKNGY